MKNFTYYNPVKVAFGSDALKKMGELLPQDGTIMMTMGKGSIRKNGVYDKVKKALAGREVVEFEGIEPNPEYENCMNAVKLAKEKNVSFLLSVGGGSVLDATKFIAAALHFEGADPWDICEKGAPVTGATPIGCVLTLPATGSEVNGNSVISRRGKGQKLAFSSPLVMTQFSILDPATTLSLDARQTANGIVDAFVHVMEQYLTYDVNTPLQDRQAEAILSTLVELSPKVRATPNDVAVRGNVMWCASNALSNLINCGTVQDWSTHIIGHEITALHGLDHAQTLAIVLPAIMQHQRKQKGGKIVQYAKRVWAIDGADDDEIIDQCIAKTKAFFEETGCPTSLSAYNLTPDDCMKIPGILAGRGMIIGERADIGEKEVEAILRLCA
ncbi:MAG: iron-containing alcohol dehydrogenase [Deltaproteobacteria bacterium]|nr:iron-containing alcohol dehydrogenase [Deltaproteobacteria bacterium]MBN2672455.1 iron-containing alcohol dehydrogenase [Deltaproteobacteria bacterium]